jgi:probable F420-dependent oxidoreductase
MDDDELRIPQLFRSGNQIPVYIDATLPQMSLNDVPAVARAAEQLGFDAVWTSETQHDPFLPCALLAEHTSRLHFGTAVAVAFSRSPANLAYTAWDLAGQSMGRFILGLGTQVKAHIERRFGMTWPESVTGRLREQILAIRALWDSWQNGTRLNFRGEYHKLTLMSPFFNPGPIQHPNVPIYIAGVNTGLARLAGEVCDGFLVHPFHSPEYLREVLLPALASGLGKAGRARTDVSVAVTAFVATNDEDRRLARSQLAFYASTPSYRPVMVLHGWGDVAERLSAHAARAEWEAMPALLTDDMLSAFCLQTTDAELPTALKARYGGLADRLSLYSPFEPGLRDAYWKTLTAWLAG